jgi:hypothetical protein
MTNDEIRRPNDADGVLTQTSSVQAKQGNPTETGRGTGGTNHFTGEESGQSFYGLDLAFHYPKANSRS